MAWLREKPAPKAPPEPPEGEERDCPVVFQISRLTRESCLTLGGPLQDLRHRPVEEWMIRKICVEMLPVGLKDRFILVGLPDCQEITDFTADIVEWESDEKSGQVHASAMSGRRRLKASIFLPKELFREMCSILLNPHPISGEIALIIRAQAVFGPTADDPAMIWFEEEAPYDAPPESVRIRAHAPIAPLGRPK